MTRFSFNNPLHIGNAILFFALIFIMGKMILPDFLIRLPEFMVIPFAENLNWLFIYIRDDLGFMRVTRGFAGMVEWLLDVTGNLLYGKNRWPHLGPLPWLSIAISAAFIGYALKGWWLAFLSGGSFVWIAIMGQWKWAMETLSVIIVAAPLAICLGLVMGIASWRWKKLEAVLNPILNIAQSLPHFAYMIPVVIFIGVGPKAGAIVTIIFATPPMIRMTLLGLKKVPSEVVENGLMCGSTTWQLLRHVRLPTARSDVLVGVNQVIMQCLAMVVLASFIGMPGLGQKLLQLLQALKVGRSIEIGITIVLVAVVLDRCSRAFAERQPIHYEGMQKWWQRHFLLLLWASAMAASFLLASFWEQAHIIKRSEALTLSKELDIIVDWILIQIDPVTLAIRAFLIKSVLIPMRDFYLWIPFSAILLAVAGIGMRIGGYRSMIICLSFVLFIAFSGWWDRAMITAYMVSFSILIAAIIGLPLGVWAASNAKRAKNVFLICDTAQTFPSFIYLIPVVMLFGVNDVAAISAVVIFAMIPMVRYTIVGLRDVPSHILDAADMAGATSQQKLFQVSLPIAVPTIMIGLNQTVMFSLFMVIIAAFIGTQDLGQEMQRALSSTDVGKGLVLGFCVAFMGLLVDHLIVRWSKDRKLALGLT